MRKSLLLTVTVLLSAVILFSCRTHKTETAIPQKSKYEIATYVYSGEERMPDPSLVTVINYAFAKVNSRRNGLIIDNEPRFKNIINLKDINPDLRVVLCIGGSSESLSQMAADSANRAAFAGDCRRIINDFGIDGIDFDWEFPGYRGGAPDDSINFTKLIKAVRDSIGPDRLLTIAGGGDLAGVDVAGVIDYIDWFNVMAYDLCGYSPAHHTSLHRSPLTGWRSVEEVVADYLSRGVTYDKMLLGLGFYGRGDGKNYTEWTAYYDCKPYGSLVEKWDSVACVPYIVDAEGNYAASYDNPRSIEIKCQYIKDKGFKGAMDWRTELDDDSLSLARTVARCLDVKL